MKRKLQVFISSTYIDLLEERQAAVQAVLSAGHIPAGMELFTAGDETQKEIIKKWIDESDAYMLILGGRYGTMLPDGSKSYTHWEYDYAGEVGKPRFALVLTEAAIQKKVEKMTYLKAIEQAHPELHKKFRESLLNAKLIKPVDDVKDIENGIFKSLMEIEQRDDLSGWVSGKEIPNVNGLLQTIDDLNKEIQDLKQRPQNMLYNGFDYEEVKDMLEGVTIIDAENIELTLAELLIHSKAKFIHGIYSVAASNSDEFLYKYFSPHLKVFGMVVDDGIKVRFSQEGIKFIGRYEIEKVRIRKNLS